MKELDLSQCSKTEWISLDNKDKIFSDPDFMREDYSCLYHAKCDYVGQGFEGPGIKLFSFRILRQTECYYFIAEAGWKTGSKRTERRVAKELTGRMLATTPSQAAKLAISRAKKYRDILKERLTAVHEFLHALEPTNTINIVELREFERFVKSLDNTHEIPESLLFIKKDYDQLDPKELLLP